MPYPSSIATLEFMSFLPGMRLPPFRVPGSRATDVTSQTITLDFSILLRIRRANALRRDVEIRRRERLSIHHFKHNAIDHRPERLYEVENEIVTRKRGVTMH
jgi:hypothetical protein